MAVACRRVLAFLLSVLAVAACAAPSAPAAPTAPAAAAPTPAPQPAAAPASPQPATAPGASGVSAAPSPSPAGAAAPVAGEVVVFAASSLTDVFQDMATAFQQANPAAKVTFNFGASSQLAAQLGQGARADVFASADQTQMDNARKSDAIAGQDQVFARNRLVLITPKDNPQHIGSVKDLANPGVKFVTAQPNVPIGQYTAQLLDKASADPTYGPDLKDRVQANTVSQEDNVRQVVSKVQLGEADAAIVYSTDPTPQVRDQLQLIQVPDALQTLATYPIAVAKGANSAGGEAFVAYVLGPDGQATLAKWGFLPPSAAGTTASAAAQATPPSGTGGSSGTTTSAVAPVPAVASSTLSPTVQLAGLVGSPRAVSREDLLALPAETVQVSYLAGQVSYLAGQGSENASYTGTRLLNVLDAAGGAKLPTDTNNAKLRVTVMVTSADGYQVAFGWGELDPEYGAAPVLLAYARDGQPLGDKQGMARLVVPSDKRGGRYASMVKRIELRDPGPARP